MKKILIIAIAVLVVILPMTTAFAAEESFTLGTGVTGVLDTVTGVLTVSGTGSIDQRFQMVAGSPDKVNSVTSIVIEDGITSIGTSAFQYCQNLESIEIAASVTNLEHYSFGDCPNLALVTLYHKNPTVTMGAYLENSGTNVTSQKIVQSFVSEFEFSATNAGYTFELLTESTGDGNLETTIQVDGSITATTISVTHSTSVSYAIDPNKGENAFISPNIKITNNSIAPINVTVKSITSAAGGTLQFTDVAANAQTWNSLNLSDSKTYIALGIQINNPAGWTSGYASGTRYAVDTGDMLFGSLQPDTTGEMALVANHGLSFDQSYIAMHDLVFIFDLT